MLFGRHNDTIYLHGSVSARMLKDFAQNQPQVCLCVTLLDGLVLARSSFHHSANYRSVVVYGEAREVNEEKEKREALKIISEHVVPGRWDQVRTPNEAEMKSTKVLRDGGRTR